MITLDQAIESAKISAGAERILRQQHYDDLLQKLAEEDHYPFTMALVELDIGTRTGKHLPAVERFLGSKQEFEALDPHPFIEDRIVRAALRRDAGWWDNLKTKVKEWTGWGDDTADDFLEEEYGVVEPPPEVPEVSDVPEVLDAPEVPGLPEVPGVPGVPEALEYPYPEAVPTQDEEIQKDIEESDEPYPRFEDTDVGPFEMPIMHPIESSNLEGTGYDEEERILYVAFKPKRNTPRTLYRYFEVPSDVFSGLLNAESKGKYFHQNIREAFAYDGPLDVGTLPG